MGLSGVTPLGIAVLGGLKIAKRCFRQVWGGIIYLDATKPIVGTLDIIDDITLFGTRIDMKSLRRKKGAIVKLDWEDRPIDMISFVFGNPEKLIRRHRLKSMYDIYNPDMVQFNDVVGNMAVVFKDTVNPQG